MVDKRGMVNLSLRLTPEQHKKLRIIAAYQESTATALIVGWIEKAWGKLQKEELK